jgi:hypothetical protein
MLSKGEIFKENKGHFFSKKFINKVFNRMRIKRKSVENDSGKLNTVIISKMRAWN